MGVADSVSAAACGTDGDVFVRFDDGCGASSRARFEIIMAGTVSGRWEEPAKDLLQHSRGESSGENEFKC